MLLRSSAELRFRQSRPLLMTHQRPRADQRGGSIASSSSVCWYRPSPAAKIGIVTGGTFPTSHCRRHARRRVLKQACAETEDAMAQLTPRRVSASSLLAHEAASSGAGRGRYPPDYIL